MGSFDKTIGQVSGTKILRDRFGGLFAMKSFLGIKRLLEQSFKDSNKFKHELLINIEMGTVPLIEHAKTREASKNTDLDMS